MTCHKLYIAKAKLEKCHSLSLVCTGTFLFRLIPHAKPADLINCLAPDFPSLFIIFFLLHNSLPH